MATKTSYPGIAGRVALVTGAAGQGIGRAVCLRLAAEGAHVVVTDVHERRIKEVVDWLRATVPDSRVTGHILDIGDRDQIDFVVSEVVNRSGPIGILVNNAAVNVMGDMFEYDYQDWQRCIQADLTGPWWLSRQVMREMRSARGGTIVNVTSTAPEMGPPDEAAYAAAKGGMQALTRCCARAGGPFGIRVVAVSTGLVLGTRFAEQHAELVSSAPTPPLGTHPSASDVAEVIAFLASDGARFVTGVVVPVTAGGHLRP
jgi:NAD(P)-dependent dehydrogenase (short-subunit alcohol dehydrogenase family)